MSKNNNSKGSSNGITFLGALQVAFIVLKLIGIIKWHWFFVLTPIWIEVILVILLIVFTFIGITKRNSK